MHSSGYARLSPRTFNPGFDQQTLSIPGTHPAPIAHPADFRNVQCPWGGRGQANR
jgi:hypothetical protein